MKTVTTSAATSRARSRTASAPAITTERIEELVQGFGDGFALVRRVEPPFKPKLRREIWTNGERVLLFERGQLRQATITEALDRWNLPSDEDADAFWSYGGEEMWIALLARQLFVELTPAEKSAIQVCAARYEGGDVAKYLRRAITTDLQCDLGEVAGDLKRKGLKP